MSTITNFPATSRIWVYQANRPMDPDEIYTIKQKCASFVNQWQAHGKSLEATYEILYNRFLVLSVNESQQEASGCSIDESVQFIKSLAQETGIDFLDRSLISYKNNDTIHTCSFRDVKSLIEQREITEDTLIFNNSIGTVGDFQERWLIPAKESWLKKYF